MDKKVKMYGISLAALVVLGLTGCEPKEKPTEEIHRFAKWNLQEENAFTMEDGTVIDRWSNDTGTDDLYKLENGDELLYVTHMENPLDVEVQGLRPLSEYSKELQEKVVDYWKNEEPLYDLEEKMKMAYEDYATSGTLLQPFTIHEIKQEFNPVFQTEHYLGYITAETEPRELHNDGILKESRKETFFDIQTGEVLDVWDFFNEDEETARKKLAVLCAEEDLTISDEEVKNTIDQASMLFFQDYFQVWFPLGTWERQEFAKGFGFEYEQIADLLKENVIPEGKKE